jgi:hypothetical protein
MRLRMMAQKDAPHLNLVVRSTGIILRFKYQHKKTELLGSLKGFEKYLSQCVVCQEMGYDPDKLELRENKHFQKRAKENFKPMKVSDIGVCEQCQKHQTKD